ncbi:uncharacterized protein rab44 isoform X2 [Hippoglossus hippoglossus]|uniref:uncharacterized protein rab44 isoform X2 n=1 Tax=Hippoglossus hippoglossus TaxID=8267 RepID=UPI00148D016A|nr:uncharacterized protein rab44 isoform X2 [Hippoglossus hippoglossus]
MRWGFLQADNWLNEKESEESSSKSDITTEKSNYREHTEPKYGVEQVAVSSPKEETSTMEGQNEHLSSSEVRAAQHSEDAVEEVHDEEVKPIHMPTMHQTDDSSVEERNPCLQTLESETKLPFDSQPVDNSVSIKEETHSGFKLTGNRRKLGSSRRLKGRQHGPEITEPAEEVVENTCSDEEKTEKEKMPTGTISQEDLKEQTSPDFNLTKKITSAVEEQENTEEIPDEDTTLSLNMMDNSTTVTTDFLNSTEEVQEAEKKFIKEPEDLTPLPVHDVVQMDLIQAVEASVWNDNSDSQNISNHDDNVRTKSVPSDVLDQEETSHSQNTESLPCDEDSVGQEICVQQTTNVNESEGDVVLNEATSLMGKQGSEEVDLEEERKDPANKDHLAQDTNTSVEVTPDEPFSVAQNEPETFEIGHEENTRAKPAEKVGISPAADTSNSRGETDSKDETDQRNLDVDLDVDVRNLDRMEVVEELSSIFTKEENAHGSLSTVDKEKDINETSSVPNDGQKLQSNTSDLQSIESNMIPNREDSMALLHDQSAFHNEEVVNPVTFVQGTDVRAGEVDVDVSAEPTQQDDFRSNEMQTTSVVIGRRSPSINLLLPPNTEDAINTDSVIIEATQSDKQSPEGIKEGLMQDQPFKSVEVPSIVVADQEMVESVIQEPNNAPEGAHKTSFEMKDSSPHVSPNRRRKMGSTRRNLGSRSKVENSHQEQTHTQSESVESSSKPEITTEKSNYREHTEPKYGVEQVALSSPKEETSTMEGQNEHSSSSEVRGAQHSADVVEEVHDEEVKPIHMPTMHQTDDSSVEERNPCLQTLESETKSPFDSQPVDNSVSIKEETHSGFKLRGNRRKLGSSRRLKGRQHSPEITEPAEEVVENTCSDEEKTEKEKMPTGTISQEDLKEQTSPDFNLTKKITSAVEEQENTEEIPDEDTTLSLNMMDNSTTVTTDFLNSTEEVQEAEKKFIKEPEDLTPLPVHDVVQMDLIQAVEASVWNDNSDSQNISNHDDNVRTKSVPSDVLDQEETSHSQNTESLPCDEDSVGQEICVQQTTNVNESEGDVVLNEATSLMGKQGSEEVDLEEERKDPANKDHLAQDTNTSVEVTPDEPFSVAQNEPETFEIVHEENTRAKPAEKVGISPAADTSNSRGETDSKDETDQRNLDVDLDVDVRNLDRMEVVEELSSIFTKEENAHGSLSTVDKEKDINETSSVPNDGQKLQSNTSDLQSIESNMIPNREDSMALLHDQSAFHNEEVVNPVTFVQGTDVRAGEVDVDVSAEPTQQDDFRSNEMQTTSVVIGRRSPSINLLLPPNTEDAINTDSVIIEATQSDKQSPEGIKEGLMQDQPFKSVEVPSIVVADQEMVESVIQEPNNAPEGAHKTSFEMKDSSPHVSPNRRRKMGSTRRNLGSRSKVENSHQEQTHTQSESVESSSKPETTTEKSNYREHTEPKYGVEQVAVSSPKEETSTMEDKTEHLSSSEVRAAQHSADAVEEVHDEEVKPIHMPTMHQTDDFSVEERNPCLQTLESETKSPFDSQPVDNSVSIKEETHSGFKLTGNRRKLGSSRRLKGRQHGPEITEPAEEVVENTCSDEEKTEKEKMPTGTISQEDLKEQTSPDFNLTKKITSAVEDSVNIEATQSDKQSPEGLKEGFIQDQPFQPVEAPSVVVADPEMVESVTQEPNNAPEGATKTNLEIKDSSSHVSSPNRRRKMGSTRRNLGSRSKVENSHQKQAVDKEDVNVGDVSPESVSVIAEKEPPINDQQENRDSEQRKEKVFETVELSHTGESQGKSPAQQTLEENPDSLHQQAETEHHLTPDYLTALSPPQHDVTSESAAGGKRRKLGSSRKSRGPQKDEDRMMGAPKETDAILTEESVSTTSQEQREESSALDEKLQVDESVKKSSSGISVSNAPEHSRPLSGKAPERGTPLQQPYAEIRLRQESQNTFALAGDSRGADVGSKRYNVMLVGDSCVGKTSLMQRAQSGKFSFDLPSSIGLDTSTWTVMVDGKPVVLQLWDTAGQERFHSITRQVFHKAQAFLLMYDVTSSQSFTAISYWANCIQEGAPEDVTILLLGNKSDCGERQVKTEEGEILAKEYNFEFMECSAATGDNVIHSLETVARMLSEKDDTSEEAMVLHKEPPRSKRSGCC